MKREGKLSQFSIIIKDTTRVVTWKVEVLKSFVDKMKSSIRRKVQMLFNMIRFYRHQYKPKVREKLSDMVVIIDSVISYYHCLIPDNALYQQ